MLNAHFSVISLFNYHAGIKQVHTEKKYFSLNYNIQVKKKVTFII